MNKPKLLVLNQYYSIHKLSPTEPIPEEVLASKNFWISRTDDELSIVAECGINLQTEDVNKEWACFKAEGILDLSVVGFLASLTSIMAKEFISIFAVSTYNTDYMFVKKNKLDRAIASLQKNGYTVERLP